MSVLAEFGILALRMLRVVFLSAFVIGPCVFARAQDAQDFSGTEAVALRPGYNPPKHLELEKDLIFSYQGQKELKLDIYRAKSSKKESLLPVALYIHGGAWRMGSKNRPQPLVWRLAEAGFASIAVEYRLSQEALFPAQLHDLKAAVRWIRANWAQHGLDPNRIGVWGISAGGHLAALLGTTGNDSELEGDGGFPSMPSRVQAVINFYGPIDLLKLIEHRRKQPLISSTLLGERAPENQLLGGNPFERKELAAMASPLTWISADDAEFLIIHGDRDETIPLTQSKMLNDMLQKAGVKSQLKTIPGLGHIDPPEELNKLALDFFARVFRVKQAA